MKNNNLLTTDGKINYKILLEKYPWLVKEKQGVIISPDVDGILCGLFMSFYFDWKVVGFYDGKNLAIKQNTKTNECIFLDVEIYRSNIKSCGHHIVLYSKKNIPPNWDNFSNCINPNIIRNHDAYNNFKEKYPLATIHFLLCIISSQKDIKITIPSKSASPLLYVDGTFKNLLNYPENCISWLKFLNAKDPTSPIFPIFTLFADKKISKIIHDMEDIFKKFKEISGGKRGGDKIKISDICNGSFSPDSKTKARKLITLLSDFTEWGLKLENWTLEGLNVFDYSKEIKEKLNNKNYSEIISKNPLSWAITATKRIEYTLEQPQKLP